MNIIILIIILGAIGIAAVFFIRQESVPTPIISECSIGELRCVGLERQSCLNGKWQTSAFCPSDTNCVKVSEKQLTCVSKISPLPTLTPPKVCEVKVIQSYCDGEYILCEIIEGSDCIWRTSCKGCSSFGTNYKCKALSGDKATCTIPTSIATSIIVKPSEVIDVPLIEPIVTKPTPEETLIQILKDRDCNPTRYRVALSSEGYKILLVEMNKAITLSSFTEAELKKPGCRLAGLTNPKTSRSLMAIPTWTDNFWKTYEHEKCHLNDPILVTSYEDYINRAEPMCIEASKVADLPFINFWYKPPQIEITGVWIDV